MSSYTRNKSDNGYLAEPKNIVTHDYMRIGDRAYRIHKVVVHRFQMSDVEDPDLYAGEPLLKWQQSEMGEWVMKRAIDTPEWFRQVDVTTFGYRYAVVAKLKDIDYTFWQLKWGLTVDDN